ncbi:MULTISPECIES: hypothetical protein [unclassified Streptomyces]|uniref:hypothetical protein n=1 Tax=unclassified Streptomyces TaxID=2593676 RepID=UPI00131E4BDF|nr:MULTISPECIES: hypothetical protein [unclassified Streptomyces]
MPVHPIPPPPIPADELLPSRHWYAMAGAIAIVLIALGAVIGAFGFNNAVDSVDTDHAFANGDTVTLRLEPGGEKSIWVRDQEMGPSAPKCSITGPGGPRLADPGIDVFLTRDETWNPLYAVDVQRSDDYQVTCSSDVPSKYAIGDSGGLLVLAGWTVLAIALAALGITTCAVIILVTAFRRSRHRKQVSSIQHSSPVSETLTSPGRSADA